MFFSRAYVLGEAEDGLLLVVRVGAEALDVDATAQTLQHLSLGEVGQALVVQAQLADQLLQILGPVGVRRHVVCDQSDQLFWVSLENKGRN